MRRAQNNGLEFWQTINNAIIYVSLVKVVERKLDDTDAEILLEKEDTPRIMLQTIPLVRERGEILCDKKEFPSGWSQ